MKTKIICWLFLFSIMIITPAFSQDQGFSLKTDQPLDAELRSLQYPHAVNFMDLKLEKQNVQMAYMDIKPKGRSSADKTVLLLHGKNFFGAYWQNTITYLTDQGYRVIVPDQVGFGKSTRAPLHYSFHGLAENTKMLLDRLRVKHVTVIGHSMGGMLATRFALMYPKMVDRLILENPIGLEDYRRIVPYQTIDELVKAEQKTSASSILNYHKSYYTSWKPEYEVWAKVPGLQTKSKDYDRVALASALTYEMIYQQPVIYDFSLLQMPTLLVIGQEDRTVVGKAFIKDRALADKAGNYPQMGKYIAAQIPNGKLVALNGVGHIPHLEAPEQFHQAIMEFMGEPKE